MSNEINVGAISEALNNKVDLNQLNTNAQGLEYVSGLSMPSSRYIDLTLGASGTEYTAPANGYFYIDKISASTNQYVNLTNVTKSFELHNQINPTSTAITVFMPVLKNDVITAKYTASGSTKTFRFYYAQGDE